MAYIRTEPSPNLSASVPDILTSRIASRISHPRRSPPPDPPQRTGPCILTFSAGRLQLVRAILEGRER
eukprot:5571046-Prymnesium_polylepis.1